MKKDDEFININKTMNIPDEMLLRQMELKEAALVEAKRDTTFEEFEKMYAEHIEGKIDPNLRVGNRPETVPWEEGSRA